MNPEKYSEEMERIEDEAPRYDVEYQINYLPESDSEKEFERRAVMKAHSFLNDDLDYQNHVPVRTSIDTESFDCEASVMFTVAAEVKRSVFEKAEAAYLVDPRESHWLWCCRDYEPEMEDDEPELVRTEKEHIEAVEERSLP